MVSAMAAVKPTSADVARFQETEIGLVPDDWIVKPLSSLADLYQPKTISANEFTRYGYPVYGANGVVGHYHSYNHETRQIAVTCRGSTCGTVNYTVERSWITGNSMVVNCDQNPDISKDFLYHCLKGSDLTVCITGTGQPQIVRTPLAAILLSVPKTMSEQQAIAEALSDADAYIESLERLIAKKREIKNGIMQRILSESDAWDETSLIELCENKKELFDDGDWIESEHITDDGVRLIQTGNIGVGKYVEKDARKYIFPTSFTKLRCKELRTGDLLICRLADPAGRACILPDIGEARVVTSVDVTICRPPERAANRIFLANLLCTKQWFQSVSDRSGGTTHKRIARGALGKIKFKLPSIELQNHYARLLQDVDGDIAALSSKLTKAHDLKRGMMQELLTGRLRLV